jgi:hypothetical protein
VYLDNLRLALSYLHHLDNGIMGLSNSSPFNCLNSVFSYVDWIKYDVKLSVTATIENLDVAAMCNNLRYLHNSRLKTLNLTSSNYKISLNNENVDFGKAVHTIYQQKFRQCITNSIGYIELHPTFSFIRNYNEYSMFILNYDIKNIMKVLKYLHSIKVNFSNMLLYMAENAHKVEIFDIFKQLLPILNSDKYVNKWLCKSFSNINLLDLIIHMLT